MGMFGTTISLLLYAIYIAILFLIAASLKMLISRLIHLLKDKDTKTNKQSYELNKVDLIISIVALIISLIGWLIAGYVVIKL
jgi:uncharacterized membrane protein